MRSPFFVFAIAFIVSFLTLSAHAVDGGFQLFCSYSTTQRVNGRNVAVNLEIELCGEVPTDVCSGMRNAIAVWPENGLMPGTKVFTLASPRQSHPRTVRIRNPRVQSVSLLQLQLSEETVAGTSEPIQVTRIVSLPVCHYSGVSSTVGARAEQSCAILLARSHCPPRWEYEADGEQTSPTTQSAAKAQ